MGGEGEGALADLGVLQYGLGMKMEVASGGARAGQGSFLSSDRLRYGSRWDHVQQVLSLPVC